MECRLKNIFAKSISAGGNCRNGKLIYIVSGVVPEDTGDPGAEALELVRSKAPDELDNVALSKVSLLRNLGNGVMEIQVDYEYDNTAPRTGKRIGDQVWYFDTTGGRENVCCGKLLKSKGRGVKPPDPGSMINWNGKLGDQCHIGGVSKIIPSMRESCVATCRYSDVSASLRRNIMELTGRVNSRAFHGWAAGEVLFLGGSSSPAFFNDQGVKLVDLTFRFAIRCNSTDLNIAGIGMGSCRGWDIAWSIFSPTPGGTAPETAGAYISSIYEEGDFSVLKLD